MATLVIDLDEVRPLIEECVNEVIRQRESKYGNRLAFQEREAAKLIGICQAQLAELRKEGKIRCANAGIRKVLYSRKHIDDFLNKT